jgi:hypothetical protein
MNFDNPVLLDLRATIVVGVFTILFGVDEVNGDDYYCCFYYLFSLLLYFVDKGLFFYVRSCHFRK